MCGMLFHGARSPESGLERTCRKPKKPKPVQRDGCIQRKQWAASGVGDAALSTQNRKAQRDCRRRQQAGHLLERLRHARCCRAYVLTQRLRRLCRLRRHPARQQRRQPRLPRFTPRMAVSCGPTPPLPRLALRRCCRAHIFSRAGRDPATSSRAGRAVLIRRCAGCIHRRSAAVQVVDRLRVTVACARSSGRTGTVRGVAGAGRAGSGVSIWLCQRPWVLGRALLRVAAPCAACSVPPIAVTGRALRGVRGRGCVSDGRGEPQEDAGDARAGGEEGLHALWGEGGAEGVQAWVSGRVGGGGGFRVGVRGEGGGMGVVGGIGSGVGVGD